TGQDLDSELLTAMLSGQIYFNAHTAGFPNGELRGQIHPLTREGYIFTINGGQEVPPVLAQATGGGMVSVDRDGTNAHYMLTVDGLSGQMTGAHFHNGRPGVNGPVIFDLGPSFMNNMAAGYWTSDSPMAFTEDMANLFANG